MSHRLATHVHVLLATARPAVATFFASIARVERLNVDADVSAHAQAVSAASVAVVDAAIDPSAALAACEDLHRARPDLPVAALVCCPHSVTPWMLRTLFGAGVTGMLDLHAGADEMARALETIAHGGSVVNLHLKRGDRALLRDALAGRAPRSDLQLRLLELVALGLPDREIGRRVHLSPHTVKHHVEQLRGVVGARNRTELAAWAGRHGFYSPDAQASEQPVAVRVTRPPQT